MKEIIVSFYDDTYLTIKAQQFQVSDSDCLEVLDDKGALVFASRDFRGVWFGDIVVPESDA